MPEILQIVELLDPVGDILAARLPAGGDAIIEYGSQLVVREGQTALFLKDGKLAATFVAGRYTLTTQNIPVLGKLMTGLVFGSGNSPFKAEVFFVGGHLFRDLRWGTPEPIYITDPIVGQMPIRAHGRFAVQIADPALFCGKMVGTRGIVRTADVEEYLRGQYLVAALTDAVASLGKPIVELPRYLRELGNGVKSMLSAEFAALGLTLAELSVNSISPTEEFAAMMSDGARTTTQGYAKARAVQMELEAKAAGANALREAGTNYREVGNTDALKTMAEQGAGSGEIGGGATAGMNLGATIAAAQMFRDALQPAPQQPTAATPVPPAPTGDPFAKIKQLKELLDMGAITQQEFDAKKSELLRSI